jgi:hypothetical protein
MINSARSVEGLPEIIVGDLGAWQDLFTSVEISLNINKR